MNTRQRVNLGYGAIGLACVVVGALVPAAGNAVMVMGLGILAHAAPSPGRLYTERRMKKALLEPGAAKPE